MRTSPKPLQTLLFALGLAVLGAGCGLHDGAADGGLSDGAAATGGHSGAGGTTGRTDGAAGIGGGQAGGGHSGASGAAGGATGIGGAVGIGGAAGGATGTGGAAGIGGATGIGGAVGIGGAAGGATGTGGAAGIGGTAGAHGGGGSGGAALLGQGSACTLASQCASTFCVDGVCCASACTDSCSQCNLGALKGTCSPVATGTAAAAPHTACSASAASSCGQDGLCDGQGHCELWSNKTSCGAGSCDATQNQTISGSSCDGMGTCKAAPGVTCAPYKCASGTAKCAITCASNSDCVGEPCVNGSCGTVANGSVCTAGTQCTSGNCVDGYCCNSACAGSCQACDVSGAQGTCTPVPTLGQPHGARTTCAGTGSCKGSCNGTSTACAYPTTVCSNQSCTAGTVTLAATCNGAGACGTPGTMSCNGLACTPTGGCYGTCTSDAQCGSLPYCNTGTGNCQATAPLGHACSASVTCQGGTFCVNGFCCGTSSCPQCQTCGPSGSCAGSATLNNTACNDGNLCTLNDTCQGGTCAAGTAMTCTAADRCHAIGVCNPASGMCSTPLATGAVCSAGQACIPWYVDCDGDTYGQKTGTALYSCGQPAPPVLGTCMMLTHAIPGVYVSNNQDCCDSDSAANPTQTTPNSAPNLCGSYDWNCDGTPVPTYPLATCALSSASCQDTAEVCFVPAANCTGCAFINGACVSASAAAGSTGGCGQPLNITSQTCSNLGPAFCTLNSNPDTTQQTCL